VCINTCPLTANYRENIIPILSAINAVNFSDFYRFSGHNKGMRFKFMMKNPVLMIGILLMTIFLFQLSEKGFFGNRARLMPSSCKSVLVKLDRRIPENWSTFCEGKTFNNLVVEIESPLDKEKFTRDKLRAALYRNLANDMILIAKNSPSDNLERTDFVRIKVRHPEAEINALTQGRYIIKLATLSDLKLISEHIKTTVQVSEDFTK
jgi:hypothetical protein